MDIYNKIWEETKVYLRKGVNKNFVTHTEGVVKAIKLLLKSEKGDKSILIPAAMLHDAGWAEVPKELQNTNDKKKKHKALVLHIKYAPEIIKKVLKKFHYPKIKINEIINIVKAHKFYTPRKLSKKLLIDADSLSDAFKKQFYCDAKEYKKRPIDLYKFRMENNSFYTKTAEKIFKKEMNNRLREIKNS
jgi:HD superfamily phosphodiesterase